MKLRVLFLFALAFSNFYFFLFAQTVNTFPYIQDFEGDPLGTEGWQANVIGGTVNWGVTGPANCSEPVAMTNNFAYICSGDFGNQQAEIVSNVFDFSDYENVNVSFEHHYRHFSNETANFSYSINNGPWIQVNSWNSDVNSTFSQALPIACESNVRFRWYYQSPTNWDWYWAVDNFQISADILPPCNGSPSAGTILFSAISEGCEGANTLIQLESSGTDGTDCSSSGLVYQWQVSPAGAGVWANIPGETNPLSLSYSASSELDFRLTASCSNSGSFDQSNVLTYTTEVCDEYTIDGEVLVTSCSGSIFYDSGGSAGNYGNSEDEVITFCSDDGSYVNARFTEFNTESNDAFGVNEVRSDILYVYDGNSVGVNPMYELSGIADANDNVPVITSNSDCLTFRFESDGSATRSGWEAIITCTDEPNTVATNFCETAPNICNLDGYTSTTSNFYNPESSGGQVCDGCSSSFPGTLDNNSYIAFQPSASSVSMDLNVFNCSGGITSTSGFYEAIQFAVYEEGAGGNCDIGNRISDYDDVYDGITPGNYSKTFTGLVPGETYYIVVDGLWGTVCDFLIEITDGLDLPYLDTDYHQICDGETADFNVIGGDSYLWQGSGVNGEVTSGVTVSDAGTYTVEVELGKPECPEVITLNGEVDVLDEVDDPVLNITGPTCLTDGSGEITNYDAGVNYVFDPLGPTVDALGNISGFTFGTSYDIMAEKGGCNSGTISFIIEEQLDTPTITIPAGDDEICEGETVALSPTTGGTWSSSDATVATIDNAGNVTGVATGTADMIFTDGTTGCSSEASLGTITVSTEIVADFDPVAPICEGEVLSPLPTTSNNGITGTWSPALDNTQTTTYTFTADAGQCSNTTDLTITVNATPTVTIAAGDNEICEGETVTLSSTTGGTWSSSDATVATIDNGGVVTGVAAGTADMIFTDGTTGCSSNASSGTITVNSSPTITIPAGDDEICEGETVALSPTTGGTWSSSDATVATIDNAGNVTGVTAGTADMIFTDGTTGCSSEASLGTITVSAQIVADFDPVAPICEGEVLSPLPTTSNNGITGTWSPALDNTQTTTYTFTADAGQCSNTTDLTITVNATPTVTIAAGDNEICEGETVTLSPTTGGTWSSSDAAVATIDNGGVVTGVVAGTADMIFTDGTTGCSINASSGTITVNSSPTITIPAGDDEICEGETVALSPTTGGTWSSSDATVATIDNGGVVTGVATGTADMIFTDGTTGCSSEASLGTITVSAQIVADFDPVAPICEGEVLSPLPTTSNNGITGTWSPALDNTQTTTYTFTADAGQCSNTTDLTITVNATPTVTIAAGDNEICEGETVTLSPTTGGTWSSSDATVATIDNGGVVTGVATGTADMIFTNGTTGCSSNASIGTISVNPTPTVSAGNDLTICEGESIILSGSGSNGNYVWNNGVTNGQPFIPTAGTTTYTVTSEENGCVGLDQVIVTVIAPVVVSFDVIKEEGCENSNVELINTTSGEFLNCEWEMGDGTTLYDCEGVAYSYGQTGCFDVSLTLTSAVGCVSTSTVSDAVCLSTSPIADFSVVPTTATLQDPTFEFSNESIGATEYEWDFGDYSENSDDVNPTHTYSNQQDGFFNVRLIAFNSDGCSDTIIKQVELREDIVFWVPNAFTPDQDKYNEKFEPIFTSGFDPYDYQLLIFNRWGEVVFESNNAEVGWDGTYGGAIVQDGTYVWKLEFKDKYTDERYTHSGHVILIK